MGHTRPLFCSFSHCMDKYSTNLTINDKSIDGMLGSRTRGGRMEGADESTELWWHPTIIESFNRTRIFLNSIIPLVGLPFLNFYLAQSQKALAWLQQLKTKVLTCTQKVYFYFFHKVVNCGSNLIASSTAHKFDFESSSCLANSALFFALKSFCSRKVEHEIERKKNAADARF